MDDNKIELSGIFKNGYGIIPKALMQKQDLRISEKAIIAYFLSYTGGGNTCFPSYAQICQDLQISKTTLSKCIHSIENKGYIKISALYPENKLRHNYKYTLIFEGLKNEPSRVKKVNLLVSKTKPSCIKNCNSNNNTNNNNIINNNIPVSLNTKEFKEVWNEWLQHRKEIKHKLTPLQANKQLKELSKYDVKIVIQTVEKSIKNGWQGLFPPEDEKKAEPKPKTLDYLECTRCKSKTYHRLEHGRWLCKICEKEYRK